MTLDQKINLKSWYSKNGNSELHNIVYNKVDQNWGRYDKDIQTYQKSIYQPQIAPKPSSCIGLLNKVYSFYADLCIVLFKFLFKPDSLISGEPANGKVYFEEGYLEGKTQALLEDKNKRPARQMTGLPIPFAQCATHTSVDLWQVRPQKSNNPPATGLSSLTKEFTQLCETCLRLKELVSSSHGKEKAKLHNQLQRSQAALTKVQQQIQTLLT